MEKAIPLLKYSCLPKPNSNLIKTLDLGQVLVAHTYNPSYSGGRDQDCVGSQPWANSFQDSILKKNPSQKRADGVAQVLRVPV
jgi:hypothetical protein